MKNSNSSNRGLEWTCAIGGVLAIVIGIYIVWCRWELLRPEDAITAWTLVIALATVIMAIGTLGLAAFAFRGLRSLKLTRTEMLTRASREAKLSAIERLEELATEVIPMNAPILDAMATHTVGVFVKRSDEVRFDPDPIDLRSAQQWVDGLPIGLHNKIRAFLNRLEAWSVYFTTGVADDAVAFGPVAPLLRSWVGQYYPVLLLERSQRRSGNFPNIVMLYTVWSNRMDAQQLETLHRDLVTQLERHRSIMARAQLPSVIGSEFDE